MMAATPLGVWAAARGWLAVAPKQAAAEKAAAAEKTAAENTAEKAAAEKTTKRTSAKHMAKHMAAKHMSARHTAAAAVNEQHSEALVRLLRTVHVRERGRDAVPAAPPASEGSGRPP